MARAFGMSGGAMQVLKVTDHTSRADIEAIILTLRAAQKRAPVAMGSRYHARFDALLSELYPPTD